MKAKYFLIQIFCLLAISQTVHAEIYRYQDANGKWQYTDKAPPDQVKSEVVKLKGNEESQSTEEEKTGEDLAEYLTKKINPGTDIEKASLAVVKVVTSYGSGSGFFINEKGYLVTNKHVVRPDSSAQIENELKQAEDNVKQSATYLEARNHDLNSYKKRLEDYKARIDSAPEADRAQMRSEYNYYESRYSDSRRDYQQAEKQWETAKDQLDERKSAMGQSSVEASFKIIFKDGTEKHAKLVELSHGQDLALLKIEGGYKTPYLEPGQRETVAQGGEIFIIGSPFGMQDMVTKGIVTRQEQDKIITDAKVNPGNSGGAMVTPVGKVIGVTSAAFFANGAEVFGFAIPIEQAQKEFGSHWQAQ